MRGNPSISTGLLVNAGICVALTVSQEVAPGKALYHTGWYALLLAGTMVMALAGARSARSLVIAGGALLIGLGGIASGLLGPDTQNYIGTPGSTVNVPELGVLRFPLAFPGWKMPGAVALSRRGRADVEVPARGQAYAGAFILRDVQRAIVHVDVWDERGNHLTVTQPQNPQFLSPFLLFTQRASIAGKVLPIDSFFVPAKRVEVKAVLLDPNEKVKLPAPRERHTPAVLYAVDDLNGSVRRNGLKVLFVGSTGTVGGLRIRTLLGQYPAVEVASAPHPALLVTGLVLIAAGLFRNRFHWRNKSSPLSP